MEWTVTTTSMMEKIPFIGAMDIALHLYRIALSQVRNEEE
jgi:hypothetical protein